MIDVNRRTASAFGYVPAALVEEVRRSHLYAVYRVVVGGLSPERDIERADGVTWILLPEHRSAQP